MIRSERSGMYVVTNVLSLMTTSSASCNGNDENIDRVGVNLHDSIFIHSACNLPYQVTWEWISLGCEESLMFDDVATSTSGLTVNTIKLKLRASYHMPQYSLATVMLQIR